MAGHRGASFLRPENTMAAFSAAIDAGADAIEFDVHATVDGQLVVVHDYDLSRTTDGDGLVHERTLDYVRSLSAGSWFDERFAAERVPLLAEVLALPVPAFELEVKGLPSKELVTSVCRVIDGSGVADRAQVTGHHHHAVAEVKRRTSGLSAGLFAPKAEPWMSRGLYRQIVEHYAIFGDFDVVHARLPDLRLIDVERLHALGLLVHAGDVNGAEELIEAAGLGADHLTTNHPAEALNLFATALSDE